MYLLSLIIILSYLVGSIPTSIILSKLIKGIDIRDYGSGNAGGSNVFRIMGWKYGILTIVLDAFKGAIAVIFVARLHYGNIPFQNLTPFDDFTLIQIFAGIAAVLGHVWTIFAGFRGGKGIATALGFLLTLITVDMLFALAVFTIVVVITKYISLGSILAAVSVPLILIVRENIFGVNIPGYNIILPFTIGIVGLILFTHRTNVKRIYQGTERQINLFKKKK
ncbi:MAG: glycerol-3-phosphate 1-O-acyltransferase PlsY [Ignavibacteriales bacterium]|nr:glycerol-3-phosphate 1-O-acyltransferase PlsY [Ignavibacteriales bacterium]